MIGTIIKSELRNITRDKMYILFAIFPVIYAVIGYYLISYIKETTTPGNPAPQIVAMFLILITSFIFGAVEAFTLLDDKDDNVLMSLKITPISVRLYVVVKLSIGYIFSFLATILLTIVTDFLPGASIWNIILIAAIGALQAPAIALIVNSFSRNKVEGFVVMKLSGLLLMVPVLVFFIQSWKEVFLMIAPGFWPGRMIYIDMMEAGLVPQTAINFSFIVYFIIGVIYNILFLTLLMKLHNKKANI